MRWNIKKHTHTTEKKTTKKDYKEKKEEIVLIFVRPHRSICVAIRCCYECTMFTLVINEYLRT